MSNIIPVTFKNHAEKSWVPVNKYSFASQDTVCPLAYQELPKAILGLPIGFFKIEDKFVLAAIQGLSRDRNLFVDKTGGWQGRYIPSVYRCYPFLFAANPEGDPIFCVDEDIAQVTDSGVGERFFADDKELTSKTKSMLDALAQYRVGRESAQKTTNILNEMNLIEPWRIHIEGDSGPREVVGFYKISEVKLNQLSAISLKKLRDVRALSVAYCQLLSMNHIGGLVFLAQIAKTVPVSDAELSFGEFQDSGTINFDNI